MIKAIIFDFEGPVITWDGKQIFEKHKVSELMDKYLHAANLGEYENIFEFYEKANPETKLTVDELNKIFKEANSTLRIRPEMISYIEELKKKYKIAILSNFTSGLENFLEKVLNIHHLFDVVVSSYNLKISKPNPKIYLYTLKKLDVKPEEAVFVDDREKNTKGAEALGIKSIVFQDFDQFKEDLQKILN